MKWRPMARTLPSAPLSAWLGCDWGPHLYYASDYFDRLYQFARHFIKAGLAYVDHHRAGVMFDTSCSGAGAAQLVPT